MIEKQRASSTSFFNTDKTVLSGDALIKDIGLISEDKRTRDANAKTLLCYRAVLARILKYAVPDFADQDVDTLADMIKADTSNSALADIHKIESSHSGLATVKFDLRTILNEGLSCEIHLDIEPQSTLRPSVKTGETKEDGSEVSVRYSLAQRGMYYISRMITEQLEESNPRYDKLKKCYSIWIVFNPAGNKPQVLDYHMTRSVHSDVNTGLSNTYDKEIDLAELVYIIMDTKQQDTREIFQFLNALFKKPDNLPKYIPCTPQTEAIYKEARNMCDIGEVRYEEGIEKGERLGIDRMAFAYLDKNFTPNEDDKKLVSTLCSVFDMSTEDAANCVSRYRKSKNH